MAYKSAGEGVQRLSRAISGTGVKVYLGVAPAASGRLSGVIARDSDGEAYIGVNTMQPTRAQIEAVIHESYHLRHGHRPAAHRPDWDPSAELRELVEQLHEGSGYSEREAAEWEAPVDKATEAFCAQPAVEPLLNITNVDLACSLISGLIERGEARV